MADTTDNASTATDTGYKDKLKKTILTKAGRSLILQTIAGEENPTLVYTRATLSSQKPVDNQGKALDNEDVRLITSLPDDLKEGQLKVDPPQDNHFTVFAEFNNKNQQNDINFSAIGWYARVDTEPVEGKKQQGKEALFAITFTTKDQETLGAGSPDHLSTESITAALDVPISDTAQIDMTVNELGYVTRAELTAWQTKVQDDISKDIDAYKKGITISLNGKDPTQADSNGLFNLPTYDKTTIDQMVAGAGKGAGINTVQGVAPDNTGNVNLTSVFYLRTDVDKLVQGLTAKINELTSSNNTKDDQITSLNNQITGLNNQINDLYSQIKFIKENYGFIKRFNDEATAITWEKQADNHIAFVEGQ